MRFQKHFHKQLADRYSQDQAGRLIAEIDSRFAKIRPSVSFARTSTNPLDGRLEFCAYFLATIQSLELHGESFGEIREICLSIAHAYVRPQSTAEKWLRRIPASVVRTPIARLAANAMDRRTRAKGHEDGFLARFVTEKQDTFGLGFGVDILECGVCKLFSRHNASKYVTILCEVDKLTSALAGLELVRSGTIADGAAKCDFRFKVDRSDI